MGQELGNMIILKTLTGILTSPYSEYKEKNNILLSSATVILPPEKLVLPRPAWCTHCTPEIFPNQQDDDEVRR